MRKFFGIVALWFGFSFVMFLCLMALENLSLVDLTTNELAIVSLVGGVLINIAFYFDNVISQ
ncbi:hypothetical protein [Sulfurimonas microaerophilic]|uniref:hypothetical protein n=1 Tax=Sulfurimonas microaerophilic TaxID=3058392 RepID=UPI00271490F6|nr:hypothetical protein [Sulfurimonas sp. hsl 1-7]